ncbi:hypothetical protein PMIN06_003135 [Paraphaeosphaeria minitans]
MIGFFQLPNHFTAVVLVQEGTNDFTRRHVSLWATTTYSPCETIDSKVIIPLLSHNHREQGHFSSRWLSNDPATTFTIGSESLAARTAPSLEAWRVQIDRHRTAPCFSSQRPHPALPLMKTGFNGISGAILHKCEAVQLQLMLLPSAPLAQR